MSKLLEAEPDDVIVAGADAVPPNANPPAHGWVIERTETNGRAPADLLSEVLDQVRSLKGRMHLLREMDQELRVDVCLTIRTFEYRMPFFFGEDVIRDISDFGASLDIDFFED